MDEQRGKRQSAKRILFGSALFMAAIVASIVLVDMQEFRVNALVQIFDTIATVAALAVSVLFGLDAVAKQIFPAWKGSSSGND